MNLGLLANIAIEYIKYGKHVSEVYSPPRVTHIAKKVGLSTGFALDLTQLDPDDGMPWDLSCPEKQAKAEARLREEQPFLLIGSPPCTAFSQLFASNITKMKPEHVRAKINQAMSHLMFTIKLYNIQLDSGRYFLHEHPYGAWSWKVPAMIALMSRAGVFETKGHMCAQGMTATDKHGTAPVFKPTRWLSNSTSILKEMRAQCTNNGSSTDHRHANLHNGVAKTTAIYPDKLCFSILRGLRNELIKNNTMYVGEIGTVCEDPEEKHIAHWSEVNAASEWFIDDISGAYLDAHEVRKARREEIAGAVAHSVYKKVPISQCWSQTGKPPIGTRWIDINKGDVEHPDYRSRWVGREFRGNDRDREDLFAATPPLEAKKTLISLCASQCKAKGPIRKLGFIDIRKNIFSCTMQTRGIC